MQVRLSKGQQKHVPTSRRRRLQLRCVPLTTDVGADKTLNDGFVTSQTLSSALPCYLWYKQRCLLPVIVDAELHFMSLGMEGDGSAEDRDEIARVAEIRETVLPQMI